METLKKLKKHDHTLTDIIKAGIFGLVLLAPCFAILTKCLYVINNKNANQSYYANKINDYDLNSINDLEEYEETNLVYYNNKNITYLTTGYNLYVDNFKLLEIGNLTNDDITKLNTYNHYRIFVYTNTNNLNCTELYYRNSNNSYTWLINIQNNTKGYTCYFNLTNIQINNDAQDLIEGYYTISFNKNSFLDNAFYYAVNEMKDSELFGWTKETGIYTAVNGMCSGLAVQDGALPVLITYWTLMTAIYIILDIVIFVFKKITHFMQ